MKFFSTIVLTAIIILGISSCAKKENYPNVPVITFKQMILYTPGDSLAVQINFTDGNGNIGYPAGDTSAPYDCYLEYLVDSINPSNVSTGIYVPVFTSTPVSPKATTKDTIAYTYLIPNITPSGSNKSLNGMIQIMLKSSDYRFLPPLPFSNLGASIKFRVWIIDNAGNVSDRVLTSAIIVPST